jgi:D-3-phosphoglycerate dehydrogenase
LPTVIITDHGFPGVELQRKVIEAAGFTLQEIKPNCKTEQEVIQKCGEADVLMVQWAPITRVVLEGLPRVRGVVRYGVGVDNIDIQIARELGCTVSNVPYYCQDEVSDHAIAMVLSLARRIPHDHNQVRAGKWGISPFLPIPAFSDLTLGFVAFGSIARKVSEKAKPFRFRQIAFDPVVSADSFAKYGVEPVDRDTLIRTANIISLHCPLLPETRQMINAGAIAQMKPGVLLVNTARGGLVNEADLVTALKAGKLAGAGLDVFEKEPLATGSPLRGLSNVILTSHAAAVSTRSRERLQIQAAEAARDILLGKRPAGALT